MSATTIGITLEVAPFANKYEILLWIGKEFIRVNYAGNRAAAVNLARELKGQLTAILKTEVTVVERAPKPPDPTPQLPLHEPA